MCGLSRVAAVDGVMTKGALKAEIAMRATFGETFCACGAEMCHRLTAGIQGLLGVGSVEGGLTETANVRS